MNELNVVKPIFSCCRRCLQYVDDTLIFIKPDKWTSEVKLTLKIFEKMSGLKVNL
jgi:hypothetical protein